MHADPVRGRFAAPRDDGARFVMFDHAAGAQQGLMPGIKGREPVVAVEFGHSKVYTIVAIHSILQTCH
ncbi:hypothetical protein D3C72_2269660 [compost metagenome]